MPDRHADHLLIGGGIAAATCARTLREEGAAGTIMLVSRELDPPYRRPPVTKDFLRGESQREDAHLHPPAWWQENGIELLTRTSVMALDTDARVATLSDKRTVAYDQALLATGAMVRRLTVDGSELDGIHHLRALGNAVSLLADLDDVERVVLVGGSYIGCEVAASLTELGRRCTIVMQESVTFERAFGERAGRFLQTVLEDHGVEVVAGEEVVGFEADAPSEAGAVGRVARVVTGAGRRLEAGAVIVGAGAVPDVMLARRSGLELGERGGVLCDRHLRTSSPGVFAAGDMCEYDSVIHGQTMRIEHEQAAAAQGHTVALNMLGRRRPHEEVPYFFSHLSDWVTMEYVGPASSWDRELLRGSMEGGSFTLFYVHGGRVAAALTVGRPQDLEAARRLISEHGDVSDAGERLVDPDDDLQTVGG